MQQAASTMLDGNGGSHVNDSFNIEIDGNNYTYVDYTNNEDSDDSDDNDSDYYEEEVSINHVPVATVLNDEKEVPINHGKGLSIGIGIGRCTRSGREIRNYRFNKLRQSNRIRNMRRKGSAAPQSS